MLALAFYAHAGGLGIFDRLVLGGTRVLDLVDHVLPAGLELLIGLPQLFVGRGLEQVEFAGGVVAPVADGAAHDRPVLLLDVGLVVGVGGPAAGEGDLAELAVAGEVVVDELGSVVGVDSQDQERESVDELVEASGDELIIANATDPAALIANARGADALVVQYASITAEILDALPQVKVVSRYGVGVDSVDIPAATARGVAVCNVPDYGTEAVSDHAIALALNAAREVARLDRGLRDGRVDFPGVRPMHLIGGRAFGKAPAQRVADQAGDGHGAQAVFLQPQQGHGAVDGRRVGRCGCRALGRRAGP